MLPGGRIEHQAQVKAEIEASITGVTWYLRRIYINPTTDVRNEWWVDNYNARFYLDIVIKVAQIGFTDKKFIILNTVLLFTLTYYQ